MSYKRQPQQLNLFSAAITNKKNAIAALEELQFAEFERELTLAREIDPSLSDLSSLQSVGRFLQQRWESVGDVRDFLARCWRDVPAAVAQNQLTSSQGEYIDRLLPRVLRVKFGRRRRIAEFVDVQEILHWGCMDLLAGDVETAREKLLESLCLTHFLRADLWGYYGDVNTLLRNRDEANAAYMRSLVINPQALDLFRLKCHSLRQLHIRLARSHTDAEARSLLLTHGWLEGLFQIPKGNTWLAQQSKHLQQQLAQKLPLYKQERWHRFSICLYLDQSRPPGEIDYAAREQMQKLDQDLFGKYLEGIARWER